MKNGKGKKLTFVGLTERSIAVLQVAELTHLFAFYGSLEPAIRQFEMAEACWSR